MKKTILLLAVPLALGGCLTIGRPFPAAAVPEIQIGKTTRDDLRRLFGEPYRQGIDDGDPTWTYVHYKYRAFGDESTRDLSLRFKADGTVKSYSFNSNIPEDQVK